MLVTIISPSTARLLRRPVARLATARRLTVGPASVSLSKLRNQSISSVRKASLLGSLRLGCNSSCKEPRRYQSSAAQLDLQGQLSQTGRVTVITGGSRGIGLHLGEAIASLGGDVAVLDVIEPKESFESLESRYGTKFRFYRTDISVRSDIEASFDQVVADYGKINNCVTAAGIALDKPFAETTWEESKKIMDINVLGTFFAVQAAVKRIIAQRTSGSIVTIASIAAHGAVPGQRVSIYGASKAAVRLMTKTLAVELAPHDIRVNSISPGFISTDMSKQFAHLENMFNRVPPAGRIGQRDDLADRLRHINNRRTSRWQNRSLKHCEVEPSTFPPTET